MTRCFLISFVFAVGAGACGSPETPPVTELNFDRPIDMAFACYGPLRITHGNPATPGDVLAPTAQPIESCNIRSGPNTDVACIDDSDCGPGRSTGKCVSGRCGACVPDDAATSAKSMDCGGGDCTMGHCDNAVTIPPVPVGQEDLTNRGEAPIPPSDWYGFILQSGPGTVVVTKFSTQPSAKFVGVNDITVKDVDPLTPGKNGISVGEDPIAIVTDKLGCFEVIANAGSCDLSALDVASAVDDDPSVHVDRLAVKNASGAVIRARPAAMVAEPGTTLIGEACSQDHPNGIVYIAYPSCHLVAAVDTSTGTIVSGIQLDAFGTPTMTTGNVSCPDECGGGGTGTMTSGARPVALDLEQDPTSLTRRLVIGSEDSANLTVVELGPDSLPVSVRPIALQNTTGNLGVTAVAMSPQVGMGGNSGVIIDVGAPGGQFQFVYAIATDDTVRVADVLSLDKECDTQVDPRLINDVRNVGTLSCFPVGDLTTPARRPGARGPGIELVGQNGDAIPTSIEIFRGDPLDGADPRPRGPSRLIGYFGVITAASGETFVLNVDDDDYPDFEDPDPAQPLQVQLPLAIGNQLRDVLPARELKSERVQDTNGDGVIDPTSGDLPVPFCEPEKQNPRIEPDPDAQTGNAGGPRSTGPATRNVPVDSIAPEKTGELPYLRQIECDGFDAIKPVSELGFAAPDAVRDLAFPDLRGLRSDETWSLTYEGTLSLDRSDAAVDGPPIRQSQIFVDASGMTIVDQARPFCAAGVELFDIARLRGCDPSVGDADCPLGYTCYMHPDNHVKQLGACMLNDEADRLANACKDFLTSLRQYTIGRAESGTLKLLPRKHVLATTPLDGCIDNDQCTMLANYAAVETTTSLPHELDSNTPADPHQYACMVDPDRAPLDKPGQTGKRCVETCSADVACSESRICRAGVCMDSVIPPQACVNAPQRYDLGASEAFTVIGTSSGYVHSIIADAGGNCIKDPSASPFVVGRIGLNPPACDPTADPRTGRLPSGTFDTNPCTTTLDHTELAPAYESGTCSLADPATTLVTRQATAIQFRNRGMTMNLVDPTYPGDAVCIGDRGGSLVKVPMVFPGYQLQFRQTAGFTPLLLGVGPVGYPIKVVRGPTQSIWVIDEGDYLSTSIAVSSTRGQVFRVEPQALSTINRIQ